MHIVLLGGTKLGCCFTRLLQDPDGQGFLPANLSSSIKGCWASEARQAEGKRRGAVGKSRTPKGLSAGLSCGQVTCPWRTGAAPLSRSH
jgi:hypothetical protein